MSNATRILVLLSATLLMVACAAQPAPRVWAELSPTERESLFLSQDAHGHEECWTSAAPPSDQPRSVAPVLDSLVVVERLAAWPEAEPGSVLLSAQVDTAFVRLRVLESNLAVDATDALVEQVRPHLRLDGTDRRWTGRILAEAGESPSLRAGYSLECAPMLLNREEVGTALQQLRHAIPLTDFPVRRNDEGNRQRRNLSVVGRYRIGEDGAVRGADVQRSSGRASVDALVDAMAEVVRFSPAILDGEPVEVWVQFPMTLQPSRQR